MGTITSKILTFLPIIIILVIGLLFTVPKIYRDRKNNLHVDDTRKYASLMARFGAFFIDFILLTVINSIIAYLFNIELKNNIGEIGFIVIYKHPIGILTGWLYFSLLESSVNQATIGKKILNIKVTDSHKNKISFLNATGRHFGKLFSGLLLFMGFIMIIFMSNKKGLHDAMANTLVLKGDR